MLGLVLWLTLLTRILIYQVSNFDFSSPCVGFSFSVVAAARGKLRFSSYIQNQQLLPGWKWQLSAHFPMTSFQNLDSLSSDCFGSSLMIRKIGDQGRFSAWGRAPQCSGTTQRDRVGREVGGVLRMGVDTCRPVADSCWCMAKAIIILQLFSNYNKLIF